MCENMTQPLQKREGNWAELTFSKTSGTVPRDLGKNWPIADHRISSSDPSYLKWGGALRDKTKTAATETRRMGTYVSTM